MLGYTKPFPPVVAANVSEDIPKAKNLTEFVRCQLIQQNGQYAVRSTGTQSSGVLSSLSLGQGLIIGPQELTMLPKGMEVKVIVLDGDEFAGEEAPF
jgi:molybdopterin molybdotransferase